MSEFVQQFDELFVSRRDVYSKGYPNPKKPGKFSYATVEEPLTPDVLRAHLQGKIIVGVYPILADNTVGWFAVDFDAPRDDEGNEVLDPFPIALEAARNQVRAFERAGLHVHLERSRSGKGVHVWGFLEAPMPAGVVRRALKPLLLDHDSFDRMFPVQDELSEQKPLGNLIALPFYGGVREQGNCSFLDAAGEIIPPRVWLATARKNVVVVVQKLAADAPASDREQGRVVVSGGVRGNRPRQTLMGSLKMISKYGCPFMHHAWVNRKALKEPAWYAAIQQCTPFRFGRELAHAISRDYKGYSPAEVDVKYDQALENPVVWYDRLQEDYPDIVGSKHVGRAPYDVAKLSILELVRSAQQPMALLGSFGEDLKRIEQYDRGEVALGVPWGIRGLDEYTRLRNSEMTVVGGMPSLGKTWLLVDGIVSLARAKVPVFFYSAETGRQSFRMRLLARAAQVDVQALRGERASGRLTAEEKRKLRAGDDELSTLPIFEDYTSLSADDVLRQIEEALLVHKIPLDSPYVIFFDYLQFGSRMPGEDTEYDRLSRLSSEFKFVAKILDKPVVVFSQLKREKEGNDEPEINWFKGTGRIESDMDVGLIITGARVSGDVAERKITVVKQREAVANVGIKFLLQQSFGRWDVLANSQMAGGDRVLGNDEGDESPLWEQR